MPFLTWMPIKGRTCYLGKTGAQFVFRDNNGEFYTERTAHRFESFEEAQRASLRADARYRDDFPRIEFVKT